MTKSKGVPAFSFDLLTPFYDFFVELLGYGSKQREKVVNLLDLKPGENLLDVGCGTGSLLIATKKMFPKNSVVGVDIDEKILKIAKSKINKENLNIELIESSADNLPFGKESFDVVVSTLIFHHLPKEVKIGAIKEIHRVLKKKGRFLLVDFGKAETWLIKSLFAIEEFLRIPEAKTAKDNIEGKIPDFLEKGGFKSREVAPRDRGIQFLLAEKPYGRNMG